MTTTNRILSFGAIGALAVAAYAVQASHTLTIERATVSNSVVFQNGQYLVPIKDVAKYFGYRFSSDNGNATLTRRGAAEKWVDGKNGAPSPAQTPQISTTLEQYGSTTPTPTIATTDGPLNPGSTTLPSTTPQIAIPGTPITTATENLFPSQAQPPAPVFETAKVGQSTAVNGFSYTIDSIQEAGKKYKLVHDQRGTTLHPNFKTDSLAVVDITITNTGSNPISPVVPGVSDITIFDSSKVGYPAGYLDIRQSSDLVNSGSDSVYDIAPSVGGTDLVLAPGGTMHFAAIASIPAGTRVSSVGLHLTGQGMNGTMAGPDTTITVQQ